MNYIIGRGILGKDLNRVFDPDYTRAFTREDFDLRDPIEKIENVFKKVCSGTSGLPRNYIINAAAYTDVDKAEEERELAFQVNAAGPYKLALICKRLGFVLVHISTDFVFGGTPPKAFPINGSSSG